MHCLTYSIARHAQVLLDAHNDGTSIEDLVLVVVDNDTLSIVVLRREEAVHPTRVEEPIVQHDRRITDLAQVVVRIAVELPYCILWNSGKEWLVDGLDCNNNIL